MPVRVLPQNPSLEHLKYQAKDLMKDCKARDPGAAQRIREFHPRFGRATDAKIFDAPFRLSDAQLTIAREAGFPSWARLKRHIEKPTLADRLQVPHHQRIEDSVFRRAVDLIDAGDVPGLLAHLKEHPGLQRQHVVFEGGNYFRNPSLLEFIAENPIRRGKLRANIVEVAAVILDAGVDQPALNETLVLAATGSVPRECGVQPALIELLCDRGADPNSALRAAAVLEELEAVQALIRRGAQIDLPVAAARGRVEEFQRLLPNAGNDDRHLALALAAQFGHAEIVRMLLDAGEDPDLYNPVGGHSHSTPLHQAALAGHFEVVKLLAQRGARLDLKDVLWRGTPADWAAYGGHQDIEAYLRAEQAKK
ncbi:MAG TPA: ankyrin repeat domain-containing protein [Candidatus Sulfotelmatobacter sp.]|nr:ankyrin repeat domain-containing protein [Candidatus Sulfotelmatobacter sp.]